MYCLTCEKRLAQPREKEALGGPNSSFPVLTGMSLIRQSSTLHRGSWWKHKRQQGQVETREVQTRYNKKLFHDKNSKAGEQVAQRGCADSSWRFSRTGRIKP